MSTVHESKHADSGADPESEVRDSGDKEIRSVFACPERGPAGTESGVSCLLIARQRNE